MECQSCGRRLGNGARYCDRCGEPVEAETAPGEPAGAAVEADGPGASEDTHRGDRPARQSGPDKTDGRGWMPRRRVLAALAAGVASGSVTGWAVSGSLRDDGGPGPLYADTPVEALFPPAEAFAEDVSRVDEYNQSFDTSYVQADERFAVLVEVTVAETVERAERRFEQLEEQRRERREFSIRDEGFAAVRESGVLADAFFRHSNAIGGASATVLSGDEATPDETRARQYARAIQAYWEDQFGE